MSTNSAPASNDAIPTKPKELAFIATSINEFYENNTLQKIVQTRNLYSSCAYYGVISSEK